MKLVRKLTILLLVIGVTGVWAEEPFLVVVGIVPGSPAAQAGINEGDVLRAYGGNGVQSIEELEAVKRVTVDSVEVIVDRGDQTLSFILPAGPIGVYLEERLPELQYASDAVVIEEVGPLRKEDGMNNSFILSLTRVPNYLRDNVDYTMIMGLSGAAFRLQMQHNWSPYATLASEGYRCDIRALEALGYEYVHLTLDKNLRNKEAMRDAISQTIDAQGPVIAFQLSELPQWGIITGYQRNGREFLVRTYDSKRTGYSLADSFPKIICLIEGRKVPPTLREAMIRSFAMAQEILETPEVGDYYLGIRAMESWIQNLETGVFYDLPQAEFDRILEANAVVYKQLIEDRGFASQYLERIAPEFPDIQDKLSAIANLYKTESEHLILALELDSCIVSPEDLTSQSGWTPQMRLSELNYLQFARIKEDEALRLWSEVNAIYNPPAPKDTLPEEEQPQGTVEEEKKPEEEPVIIPKGAH